MDRQDRGGVPAHAAAVIYRDMKRAGVDKVTPLGKLDFHALRTAYINFVLRDSTLSPTCRTWPDTDLST